MQLVLKINTSKCKLKSAYQKAGELLEGSSLTLSLRCRNVISMPFCFDSLLLAPRRRASHPPHLVRQMRSLRHEYLSSCAVCLLCSYHTCHFGHIALISPVLHMVDQATSNRLFMVSRSSVRAMPRMRKNLEDIAECFTSKGRSRASPRSQCTAKSLPVNSNTPRT